MKNNKLFKIIAIILVCVLAGYFVVKPKAPEPDWRDSISQSKYKVESWAIYGTHLYMTLDGVNEYPKAADSISYKVVLMNDENLSSNALDETINKTIDVANIVEDDNVTITIGKYINSGIDLETIPNGDYHLMVVKTYTIKDKNDKSTEEYEYLYVENASDYSDTVYYTLTKDGSNNKIDISFVSDGASSDLMTFTCKETTLPDDVYDIVIEVGHGDDDVGATGTLDGKRIYEKDLNLSMAKEAKRLLEEAGFKVALTREDDTDTAVYGKYSRSGLANTHKAKLNISLHNNAEAKDIYTGTEVYVPYNCDITFAKKIADSFAKTTYGYSTLEKHKVDDGVYMWLHDEKDIEEAREYAKDNGYELYETLCELTPYHFMIREVGGISTLAYADGRNPNYEANPYYNSNNTCEAYIVECGYVNNKDNLRDLVENLSDYPKALCDAIIAYYLGE